MKTTATIRSQVFWWTLLGILVVMLGSALGGHYQWLSADTSLGISLASFLGGGVWMMKQGAKLKHHAPPELPLIPPSLPGIPTTPTHPKRR